MIRTEKGTRVREASTMAIWGCLVLSITGVFVTVGCLLAIYLEATGMGAPRDLGMRPGYTALLITTAMAGILTPAVVCLAVLRASQRLTIAAAASAAVVVAIAILGMMGIQQ